MAYTPIDKPDDYFNTVLYTGNSGTQSITGVNFQPDFTWIKDRIGATSVYSHYLFDGVRGATKYIKSNSNDAEATGATYLTSFDTDGFSLGSYAGVNASGDALVSWNWKAGGTAVSNTAGSITTNVSVNTTAGFSIVTYTGTGSNATIGHGLGVKPDAVFFKRLDTTGGWASYHSVLGATKYMRLDSTSAEQTATDEFQSTEPTVDEISIGTDGAVNGTSMVAYCFADVKGFSKFGSYTGNGSADGTFVYTGFKPAFILIKCTSTTGTWMLRDTKRDPFNVSNTPLAPNDSANEGAFTPTLNEVDILSNGFKLRDTYVDQNQSGASYIYMAFAEQPFVTSTTNGSIPATAR
jgi:hypothetical protein